MSMQVFPFYVLFIYKKDRLLYLAINIITITTSIIIISLSFLFYTLI